MANKWGYEAVANDRWWKYVIKREMHTPMQAQACLRGETTRGGTGYVPTRAAGPNFNFCRRKPKTKKAKGAWAWDGPFDDVLNDSSDEEAFVRKTLTTRKRKSRSARQSQQQQATTPPWGTAQGYSMFGSRTRQAKAPSSQSYADPGFDGVYTDRGSRSSRSSKYWGYHTR
mmetsp:Transcript_22579/g.57623  ORF Transcript_22579/g.57623 Transcript_22579/m.57623 type:complete len:171 (-) Transcript_22579:219-731(-)